MTVVQYCIGQHNITTMDKALVDRGANGEICGADMLVLEGSESYVDVSGLAGHKDNQLRVVASQALITTHKGDAITTFIRWLSWNREVYIVMYPNGKPWSRHQ
jgi:hypothetical protein